MYLLRKKGRVEKMNFFNSRKKNQYFLKILKCINFISEKSREIFKTVIWDFIIGVKLML